MKLFYCLRNKYVTGLLVGHTTEEGQEDVFQERLVRDGYGTCTGLLFGPTFATTFVAYMNPIQRRQVPISDLRHYEDNSPQEWLQNLAVAWSYLLMSQAAREVFLPDVLGNLHLEDVPTLATREAQP